MNDKQSAPDIFQKALEIADATERATYLDEVCGKDADLRAEVDSLLAAHNAAGGFLEPLIEPHVTPELEVPGEKEGDQIGRYKLRELIGEGGFGRVWMAEQQEPMRRMVALKIVKLGMDTGEVLGRFESERQALAMMDHPHIAKVFDGGSTESGRPYFVMELVRGVAITEYCDVNKLSPRERIDLFQKVCQAVQHAHQKGVIHRDLKPTNILVTVQDDKPVPKVIDFGVAKALQARLTERTMFTRFSQWIGTPAYMSPEQAGLGSHDVDTRSDVYSLGTVLYELLTGSTPFDSQKLREQGYEAVLRTIREEDVPKASTRLSALAKEEIVTIAGHRSESPEKLDRDIKGELDWILLKALERDRSRRYETVSALTDDLRRYMDGAPVTAVPPTFFYQSSKYIRKRWKGASVAASIALLVIAGVIVSTVFAIKANEAEHVARDAEKEAVDSATKAEASAIESRRSEAEARAAEHNARQAEAKAQQSEDEARRAEKQALTAEAQARKSEYTASRQRYNANMLLAASNWENHDSLQVRGILEKVIPEKGGHDFRGWEWYYLRSLLHQELHILQNEHSPAWALAWSPDSKRVAAAGKDGAIRVWDVATAKRELQMLTAKGGVVPAQLTALAWSPDGKRIVSGSDVGAITVWDSDNGASVFRIHTGNVGISSLAYDSTGKRVVSGSADGRVHLWDLETGRSVYQLKHHKSKAVSVLLTDNDESLIAVFKSGWVAAWSLSDGGEVYVSHVTSGGVKGGALVDGQDKLFLYGGRSKIVAVVASTGVKIGTNREHPDWTVSSMAVSPDGQHISTGGRKGEVVVRDSHAGVVRTIYPGRNTSVIGLAYSPDGYRLASASAEGTVSLWDARRLGDASVEIRGSNWIGDVRWSPTDDRLIIDEMQHYAKVVRDKDGSLVRRLGRHKGRTMSVAWAVDGKRVATAGYYEPVKVWDPFTGELLKNLKGEYNNTFQVVWSPNGNKLAGLYAKSSKPPTQNDGDWQLCIWDVGLGEVVHRIEGDFQAMEGMDWSTRGLIAVPANRARQVDVYDAKTGEKKTSLSVGENEGWAVRSVAWSPDGRYLAGGGGGGMIHMWDITTGEMLYQVSGHTDRIFDVAWSPDGSRIATAGWDKVVKIWNSKTGELVFIIRNPSRVAHHNKAVWSVDWNRDGRKLAIGSMDFMVRIYDASVGYQMNEDLSDKPTKKKGN